MRSLSTVVLTGGVFQNARLSELVEAGLRGHGLEVLVHRTVPPNDGGISIGQGAIAALPPLLRLVTAGPLEGGMDEGWETVMPPVPHSREVVHGERLGEGRKCGSTARRAHRRIGEMHSLPLLPVRRKLQRQVCAHR